MHHLMHKEIRNEFKKGVLAALIKYIYGFNMYKIRDRSINKLKQDVSCLRHSNNKTQKHLVQYYEITDLKEIFMSKLKIKLNKVSKKNMNREITNMIINDIK